MAATARRSEEAQRSSRRLSGAPGDGRSRGADNGGIGGEWKFVPDQCGKKFEFKILTLHADLKAGKVLDFSMENL